MNTVQDVLQACSVKGTTVVLPDVQLERKLYQDVAKKLQGIGGKWNRKAAGFIFPSGYEDQIDTLLGRVQAGEKINLKQDFQFFPTPDDIADWLVELADIKPKMDILEPSAGG